MLLGGVLLTTTAPNNLLNLSETLGLLLLHISSPFLVHMLTWSSKNSIEVAVEACQAGELGKGKEQHLLRFQNGQAEDEAMETEQNTPEQN